MGGEDFYRVRVSNSNYPFTKDEIFHIPFHLKKMRDDPDFEDYVKCRWVSLRSTTFSPEHINYLIDSLVTYLGPAIGRNYDRWSILGTYVWPNYFVGNTYAEEITYLKSYIQDRVTWIDNNLPGNSFYCNSIYLNRIIITEINYNEANDFILHTLLAAVGIRKGSHRAPEAELLKFAGNAS